ncbi:flagellar basal body M-ring protein FliF [Jeotgalibacillus sp. S-D1]|uniref:flagellar basal-body MS-ring/collar protein FliF n=1 Tax=Jeotgalibacillus sp. S-D1 TaxID=2552189 RepID=UPI0010598DA3|nr:flagellar basal-body MS-ring/collar protein FliF [Jeotgalibacillus sp. S-D1]TDL35046.1 flagellar basal body M-ring protein FliF [Jeotgalibacillus sp. S-D1]
MNVIFQKINFKVMQFLKQKSKKQLIYGGVLLFVFLLIILFISVLSTRSEMAPLYSDLTPSETGMIKENLDGRGIASEIVDNGTAILVPEQQVETLMVELAAEGLPQTGNIDYSYFSENAGFGMTDNEFKVLKMEAMQTELAELIKSIDGVQDAKVMITLPEQAVFLNDSPEQASASIVVHTKPGYQFDNGQISSLYHLVSKSIPNLPPENIVIMNQLFEYFDFEKPDSSFAGANVMDQMEIKQTIERDLQRQVQMMLGTLMGQNKVMVSITTDIDFDQENREENLISPVDEENMEGIEISAQRISETFEGNENTGGLTEAGDPGDTLTGFVENSEGNGNYENVEETINKDVNRIKKNIVESPYRIRDIGFQVMVEPPEPENEASLPQNRIDDIESMLETIIRTSIDNEFSDELTEEELDQKVVVSLQPFNGRVGAEETVQEPSMPWWIYAGAGLLIVIIAALIIYIVRSRKRNVMTVEEDMLPGEQEFSTVAPDLLQERESEETIRRKQIEKMAQEKPEDFAKLLRSWIAKD